MSNSKIDILTIKIIKKILEAVKGEDAPYNYSKLVSEIKLEYPEFPINLGLKKSSEFVDILVTKGLVAKAYPKGKTNLYLQPTIPLNQWVMKLSKSTVDNDLFFANPTFIPSVKFDNWVSFLDFLDRYPNSPRFVGNTQVRNINQFESYNSFSIIYEGICYFTEKLDFEKISQIREVISFGITYKNHNRIVGNYQMRVRNILSSYGGLKGHYRHIGKQIFIQNSSGYSLDNYSLHPDISIIIQSNHPYNNFQKIKNAGFNSFNHFIEGVNSGLLHPDLLDKFNSDEFKELEKNDRKIAILAGYKDSHEFNNGIKAGFLLAEEYRISLDGKFDDVIQFNQAIKLGFKTKKNFLRAKELNYKNKNDFIAGNEKGFHNGTEFYQAKNGGFENVNEYRDAKSVNITTKGSYDKWINQRSDRISKVKPKLLDIINTFKNDTYSLTKIFEFVKHTNPNFSLKDLEYLLITDTDFKRLGNYREDVQVFIKGTPVKNSKKEFFTPKVNNNGEKVVVDGSNVAHHAKNDSNKEPQLENIKLMIEALNSREISYVFYVRSNLKYQIDNRKEFEKLISKGEISELPAGAEDDEYILKHAITTNSKIISNDKFRDYQKENPKLADKIRNSTVTFDIQDGIVTFSDLLDDWLKNPSKKK